MCVSLRAYLSDSHSSKIPLRLCNTCLATYCIEIWRLYIGCPNLPEMSNGSLLVTSPSHAQGYHYFFLPISFLTAI